MPYKFILCGKKLKNHLITFIRFGILFEMKIQTTIMVFYFQDFVSVKEGSNKFKVE